MGEKKLNSELVQGNTYLVQDSISKSIIQIKVLLITNKAYQLEYISGDIGWQIKKEFEKDYNVFEDISDFIINEPQKNFNGTLTYAAEYEKCYVCHGTGTVPDTSSTAGNKTCPLCQGNKLILKTVKTS